MSEQQTAKIRWCILTSITMGEAVTNYMESELGYAIISVIPNSQQGAISIVYRRYGEFCQLTGEEHNLHQLLKSRESMLMNFIHGKKGEEHNAYVKTLRDM